MPTHFELPPEMHLEANAALMDGLADALSKKVPTDAFRLSTCFADTITGKYFKRPKFLVSVDTSFADTAPQLNAVMRSFGLKEDDFKVSLRHIFLREAVNAAADAHLQSIADRFSVPNDGTLFGRYEPFISDVTPHDWSSQVMLALWFKDAGLIKSVVSDARFATGLSVNVRGMGDIPVDIYHTLTI